MKNTFFNLRPSKVKAVLLIALAFAPLSLVKAQDDGFMVKLIKLSSGSWAVTFVGSEVGSVPLQVLSQCAGVADRICTVDTNQDAPDKTGMEDQSGGTVVGSSGD